MTIAQASSPSLESRQFEKELDRRYGRIAISALVAALRYRGETKNKASAPAETHD